ncbi:MAG: gliding motility-associated C-terminal domain-containing protein [Cytophagaceae bacterium]
MDLRKIFFLFLFLLLYRISLSQMVFFSGNDFNSVFICEDGRVFMSGENNTGQLGNGTYVPSYYPVEIAGIDGIGPSPRCKQTQIEGFTTFLALTQSGDTVISWGVNWAGQIGDGTTIAKNYPVRVRGVNGEGYLQNIIQIATGNSTSYALTEDGKVLTWGGNVVGQTGRGNFDTPLLFPDYVLKAEGDTLQNVKAISAGGVFGMALLCDGTVWAWGYNNPGCLGQGNTTNSAYALQVKNHTGTGFLEGIIKIEAGDNYAFALSNSDTLWCWGADWHGQLGIGSWGNQYLPTYVRNSDGNGHLTDVVDLAAGQGHALAVLSDRTVVAWGLNDHGQLGNDDAVSTMLPQKVKDHTGLGFLSDVNYIGTGDMFSIARTTDNKLYVWGENTLGQLGVGDHVHRYLPVEPSLACEPTSVEFPGTGKMNYTSNVCAGNNSGNVYLTNHHHTVTEWQQSTDNFASFTSIDNKDFSLSYANLNRRTWYRTVLSECGADYYSPDAVISINPVTQPGIVNSSTTVRLLQNHDTLQLTGHNGSILRWEYSTDNFQNDINTLNHYSEKLVYSGIQKTTWYRALVKSGACPPEYSEVAEIKIIDESAIVIYNAFTPNGDDYNDEWIIDHIELFPQNTVEIYNRWGQLVYHTEQYDNVNNVWNGESNVSGTLGGNILADGTYYYVVRLHEDHPVLKGFVVISR